MRPLSFWDHVEELRHVLLRCVVTLFGATLLAFLFHKKLIAWLLLPLGEEKLYLLSPLEGFACATKCSLWAGTLLSSPVWLFFLARFFLPAFRKKERRLVLLFLVLSGIFSLGGAFFAYKVTLPYLTQFFKQFNAAFGENLWNMSQTLHLILGLILAHALVFELYVLLLFLIHMQLLSHATLRKARKASIVAIFVLAAILTPPDVLSQLLLAFPMILLFESALLYARFIGES